MHNDYKNIKKRCGNRLRKELHDLHDSIPLGLVGYIKFAFYHYLD